MKYSSATLRPPKMATALSATNSLLCMRLLTVMNWWLDHSILVSLSPSRAGSGLNNRTCTPGYAASPDNNG